MISMQIVFVDKYWSINNPQIENNHCSIKKITEWHGESQNKGIIIDLTLNDFDPND